ncbi:Zinc finger AN1 and C2H2 domain-containing stress-associated protein 16 [Symbiodinium microadriaticum]|uniref:Zinc finger AN1 and C2H2 domain-containing stress-associated protein 16 n=1 Tax=Symbiodinium microadriaticum TaxID=2951 RepID=A0A1Q9CVM5_SYMMI|nr:Zinc finger AN1 and C2H2 domain-containing stress-associated protein 16 [Symbiodinium microadriaticum]
MYYTPHPRAPAAFCDRAVCRRVIGPQRTIRLLSPRETMTLLTGLFRSQGRTLVVVSSQDATATEQAEAYLRCLPLVCTAFLSRFQLCKAEPRELMEVEVKGAAHCSFASCRQLDFLPFKCDACQGIFCQEHFAYASHNCQRANSSSVQVVLAKWDTQHRDFVVTFDDTCDWPQWSLQGFPEPLGMVYIGGAGDKSKVSCEPHSPGVLKKEAVTCKSVITQTGIVLRVVTEAATLPPICVAYDNHASHGLLNSCFLGLQHVDEYKDLPWFSQCQVLQREKQLPCYRFQTMSTSQVLICPMCDCTVRMRPDEDPNITWERHFNQGCKQRLPSKTGPRRCPVAGCKEKLGPSNKFDCPRCNQTVCLKHRFEDAHDCRKKKKKSLGQRIGACSSTADKSDSAGHRAMRSLMRGAASAVTPEELSKVRGEFGSVMVFSSDPQYINLDYMVLQRCLDKLRRVPLRALRMCLGEVGDYAEFARLFVEEQDGAQITAEMAFARHLCAWRPVSASSAGTKWKANSTSPYKALRELNHDAAEKSANGKKKVKVSKPVEVHVPPLVLPQRSPSATAMDFLHVARGCGPPQVKPDGKPMDQSFTRDVALSRLPHMLSREVRAPVQYGVKVVGWLRSLRRELEEEPPLHRAPLDACVQLRDFRPVEHFTVQDEDEGSEASQQG